MRISTSFGERKQAIKKEVNSNVFLAFEGDKTEPLYFDEISRRRKELGFCEDYVLKILKEVASKLEFLILKKFWKVFLTN
jgi:hypothetical protein